MGWHESILEEGRMPTRHELDPVSPNNPVFIPRGGHVVTVNTKALELAGITKDTPNPEGGIIVRDDKGEATGMLLQNAANLVRRILPPPPANMAELLVAAMRDLNSYGIVGVVEPGVNEQQMALYRSVHDAGQMTVRTDVLYRAMRKDEVAKGIAAIKAQKNSDMLRFVGIKFPLDGGVEGGRMTWPYRIVPGEQTNAAYRGVLLLPPGGEDEYVEGLKLIADAGLQAQTHAVGDETIDLIVRAYGRVNSEKPIKPLNWLIMHLFHPSDAALKKMAEIGIAATMQDHPVLLGHNQRRWWGDEHAAYAIPIRKAIDAGVLVGGGTDGPVVPVDPYLSMWWMTTRQVLKGYALGKEHAITAKEALQLYTINNARVMGVEKERGSIEAGKLADLAVLSQDILAVPPDAIRETKALMTVVGGKVVYRNGLSVGACSRDTHRQHPCDMQRLALRAVVDLVPAGGAVRHDERIGVGLAHRGQQRKFAHRKRHIDRVGAVAERARHPAAARVDGLDLEIRDELQDALDRAHHAERLLVTVTVDERALGQRLERQVEPAGRRLAHQKLLEHQRMHRKLLRRLRLDHRRHFVAEAEDAARLQPDHRHAALHERLDRRDHALGLAPRLIDTADGKERAAAAERALHAIHGFGDVHLVTRRMQHCDGRVEVLALEIAVERIGEQHDLARLVVVRALADMAGQVRQRGERVVEHIGAPLRQRAATAQAREALG